MRGGHRYAEMCRAEKRHGAGGFCGKSTHRLQPRDSRSHGMNNTPAARERTESDGGMGEQYDPKRDREMTGGIAYEIAISGHGEKSAGNDAHGFLRVVGAVTKTVGGRGDELAAAK